MSLDGAQLIFVNATGVTKKHEAKGRKFIVGSFLGSDLVLPDAERLHCEILCDAFGRVTIHNNSKDMPIMVNDQVMNATNKRPLLHGSRIQILNDVYTWHFPRSDDRITPDRTLPEQAPNSSPTLKSHRQRRQLDNRFTVHNFRYSINSDDEGNTSIESRELEANSSIIAEKTISAESPESADSSTPEQKRSTTPTAEDIDETTPKIDLLEATQNKENTSTQSNKLMLQLCARSDLVITSFSPRETGVRIEKSFTRIVKPSTGFGQNSTPATPKSVYNTPKGVLSELNDDSCSRDLQEFSTPSSSKKAIAGKRESSMYLIDLTTPQKLRPTLSTTPKTTPGCADIISIDSSEEYTDSSPSIIDITSMTPDSSTPAKPKQQNKVLKTPKEQLLAAGPTPKRTPQSLMKRALLTSVKKKIIANINTPKTPTALPNERQSLLGGRRQCLTAPRRLPFHPQPQWRTPARRPGIQALTTKAPQTSPRKRLSMSLSSPRENKISLLRKSLAAAAKISPNVVISNKLVAKARRALNSPKQNSPKRIESPKIDTETLSRSQEFSPHETSTPDGGQNSSAELSRTFTIDDDNHDKSKDMTKDSISALEMMSELVTDEYALNVRVKTTEDSIPVQKASKQLEISLDVDQKSDNRNENEEKEALNKTFDANTSQELSSDISTKDAAVHIPIINEPSYVHNKLPLDGAEKDLTEEKSLTEFDEKTPIKSLCTARADAVIDDSICEEVPTTPTQGQHEDVAPMNDVQLVDDTICDEVPTSGEDTPTVHVEVIAAPGETPIPRRSLRRLSIDQNTRSMTPRRSVRRASMDANVKIEQCTKPSRRASYSAVVESKTNAAIPATPKRKRRLTEELSTPTRKSLRLCNTPKKPVHVDDAVGDMGVILEEDGGRAEADRSSLVLDEDYGTVLPAKDIDEHDKIDYHGMRELLKTPKSCSTPHFKGLREMIRTPKVQSSPMLDNIHELLEPASIDISNTPKRHLTVSRVTLELSKSESNAGDAQDMYFKTPRGKNIMIPIEPASAVLKTQSSLATTTEYDLNATDATLHLDKIFDDVLTTEATNAVIAIDESENEMNVTEIGTAAASEVDPLGSSVTPNTDANDTVRSEKLMNFLHTESARKDPLTSTTFKNAPHSNQDVSAMKDKRPKSPDDCEMSGIQFLDQTTDSMFSEALVVTGVDSFVLTVEETKTAENRTPSKRTSKKGIPDEGSDTDSMVGLAEPLVVSDDDSDVEELEQGESLQLKEELSKVVDKESDKSVVIKDTSLQIDSEQDATLEEHLSEDQENNKNDLDSLVDIKSIKPNDSEITTIDESIQQFDNKEESTIYPVDESELVVNKTNERSHTDKEEEESPIDDVDNTQNECNNDSLIEEKEETKTEEDLAVGLETLNQLKRNDTSIMEINTSSNGQAKSTESSSYDVDHTNQIKSSVETTTADESVVELETSVVVIADEIEKIQAKAEGTTAINCESKDVENLKLDLVNSEVDNENESIADTSSSVADVIEDPSNQAELHALSVCHTKADLSINEDPTKGNKEHMESLKNENLKDIREEKSKPVNEDDCIVTEAQNESLTETESVSEIVTTSPVKILTKPKEEVDLLETQSASEHTSVTTSPGKTKTIEEVPTLEESVIDLDVSSVEEHTERGVVETPLDNCSIVEKVDLASENISNPSEQESIEDKDELNNSENVKLDTSEIQNNVNVDNTINEEASVSFDKQLDEQTLLNRTVETSTTSQNEKSLERAEPDNVKTNDVIKDNSETVGKEDQFVDSIPEEEPKETIVSEIVSTEEKSTGAEKPDTVDVQVILLDEGVNELENSSCETNVPDAEVDITTESSDNKSANQNLTEEKDRIETTKADESATEVDPTKLTSLETSDVPINIEPKETIVSEIVSTEEKSTEAEKPDTVDAQVIHLDEGINELENSSCDTNVPDAEVDITTESSDNKSTNQNLTEEKDRIETTNADESATEVDPTKLTSLETSDVPINIEAVPGEEVSVNKPLETLTELKISGAEEISEDSKDYIASTSVENDDNVNESVVELDDSRVEELSNVDQNVITVHETVPASLSSIDIVDKEPVVEKDETQTDQQRPDITSTSNVVESSAAPSPEMLTNTHDGQTGRKDIEEDIVVELDDSRVEELANVDQNVITVHETVPASLSSIDIVDKEPAVEKDETQTEQQRPDITSTSNMVESSAAPSPEMLTNTHDGQTGGKDIEDSIVDTVLTTEKPLYESEDTKIPEDASNNSKEGKELISDTVITAENTLVKTEGDKLSAIDGKQSNESVLQLDTEDNESSDDILQKSLEKEAVVNEDKLVVENIDELSKEEDTSGMAKPGEKENDLPEPDSESISAEDQELSTAEAKATNESLLQIDGTDTTEVDKPEKLSVSISSSIEIRSVSSPGEPVIELDNSDEDKLSTQEVKPTSNNTTEQVDDTTRLNEDEESAVPTDMSTTELMSVESQLPTQEEDKSPLIKAKDDQQSLPQEDKKAKETSEVIVLDVDIASETTKAPPGEEPTTSTLDQTEKQTEPTPIEEQLIISETEKTLQEECSTDQNTEQNLLEPHSDTTVETEKDLTASSENKKPDISSINEQNDGLKVEESLDEDTTTSNKGTDNKCLNIDDKTENQVAVTLEIKKAEIQQPEDDITASSQNKKPEISSINEQNDDLKVEGLLDEETTASNKETDNKCLNIDDKTENQVAVTLEIQKTEILEQNLLLENLEAQSHSKANKPDQLPKKLTGQEYKPSADLKVEGKVEQKTDPTETSQKDTEKEQKTKRTRRKSTAKEAAEIELKEDLNVMSHVNKDNPEVIQMEKPKRRGRHASSDVIESKTNVDEGTSTEKTTRRGRKPSADVVENATHSEEPINAEKPKRRGRKPSVDVAETKTHSEEDIGSEKPKRRGRRASLEAADNKVDVDKKVEGVIDSKAEATVLQDIKPVEKASPEPVKEKPKRRNRKASAEITEENEKLSVPETKPKRNTPKKSAETVEGQTTSKVHLEKIDEAAEPEQNNLEVKAPAEKIEPADTGAVQKAKRRGRKPSANDAKEPEQKPNEAADAEKPRSRKRSMTVEPVKEQQVVPDDDHKVKRRDRKQSISVEHVEEPPTVVGEKLLEATAADSDHKVKRRGRKRSTSVEHIEVAPAQKVLKTTDSESEHEPKRRGNKKLKPAEDVEEEKDQNVILRGRKRSISVEHVEEPPSVPARQLLGETDAHADQKVKRRGRKRSISVEHIEESQVAPAQKLVKSNNLDSEHEVKRRGNKKAKPAEDKEETSTDAPDKIVETSAAREKSVPRRGRKATTDEDASTTEHKPKRRGQKNVLDEPHIDEPVKSIAKSTRRGRMASADVADNETPVDKKPTRGGRKPSANVEVVEEPSTQQKKETTRKVRKGPVSVPNNELDEELKKQNVSIRAIEESTDVIVVIESPKKQQPPSSEDEQTPRRREGRNLPRKNYDETSDEDMPASARKVLSSKVATIPTAGKTLETERLQVTSTPVPTKPMTPVVTAEPVEQLDLHTPEPTNSQKREGRNMPRKNYNETSDDEKPGTSRGRRVRNPTVKALELLVDSTPRTVPKRRKGKVAADVDTEEPVEKTTVEESTPISTKARAPGRRKAQVVDEPTSVAEGSVSAPSKRVARSRKESGDETAVAKVDQKQATKRNARGNAGNAKTTDEKTEDRPATKKARGGARALTPAVVEPEKIIDLDDIMNVPVTKPTRSRAARTIKVTEEAEIVQEALPPTRTGRGRKVHFETTEDVPSATMEPQAAAADAPKRATRSRRK